MISNPLNPNPDCIFYKVVAGELPSIRIYEDNETIALLSTHPVHPGHTVVIPKDHFENIYTVPPELWARITLTVQKVSLAIREAMDADGINLEMNNERAAGQEILHAHIHIVPRHNDDGLEHWHGKSATEEERKAVCEKIKTTLTTT